MKLTHLLATSAALTIGAPAVGLTVTALALPALAVTAVAFLVLIAAHDYTPRRLSATAVAVQVNSAERLPYAA